LEAAEKTKRIMQEEIISYEEMKQKISQDLVVSRNFINQMKIICNSIATLKLVISLFFG